MKKRKKSQGLPLNTIIVAILVLIVLVIIVLIFTGRMAIFRKGIEDCASKGGIESNTEMEGYACYSIKDDKYCCIPMSELT